MMKTTLKVFSSVTLGAAVLTYGITGLGYLRSNPDNNVYYYQSSSDAVMYPDQEGQRVTLHKVKPQSHSRSVTYSKPAYLFPEQRTATGKDTFIFDPKIRMWGAYDAQGNLVKTGRASGGRNYCPDIHRACHTPTGVFAVHGKGGANCKSSIYPVGKGGAPMPWCMYFKGGYAVHGSYDVPNYNASHGCIRVQPSDAHWLSENFMRVGTTVIVEHY